MKRLLAWAITVWVVAVAIAVAALVANPLDNFAGMSDLIVGFIYGIVTGTFIGIGLYSYYRYRRRKKAQLVATTA